MKDKARSLFLFVVCCFALSGFPVTARISKKATQLRRKKMKDKARSSFLFVVCLFRYLACALWGPEGAKRIISRTPNAVLVQANSLRQEEASVTVFHASME